MTIRPHVTALLFVAAAFVLSACDSSEERAEKHFESAMELLAEGDETRAIIEFRNVLKLNDRHREARSRFAAFQRDRGNLREAAVQYLTLVEQYPADFGGQVALIELYAEFGDWEEMERHLQAATALQPDDVVVQSLQLVFDYRKTIEDRDMAAAAAVIEKIAPLSAELPGTVLLYQALIDFHVRSANYKMALVELDRALGVIPDDRVLLATRLSVLASLGDGFGVEAQLRDMIKRFPDDETSGIALVRWYISQDQLDAAEEFLRASAGAADSDIEDKLALVQFLTQLRGEDVALNELNQMISVGPSDPLLEGLRAGYEFDRGNRDLAIQQLRTTLDGLEPSPASRRIATALARMLEATGNLVGARSLVEQVLEEDELHVAALKLKANWLISDDQVGDAILMLRTALDQAPQDADILTLLARAHDRDGNSDLVGEMLALALETSNGAPEEAVRYARHLNQNQNFATSEGVLIDSLRLAPGNLAILEVLGGVYVATEDWARAEQVEETIRRQETPQSIAAANELRAGILQNQRKLSESVEFLESQLAAGNAGFGAHVTIVRNYLNQGNVDEAKAYVAGLTANAPDDPEIQFLDASVDVALGEPASAEAKFRNLVTNDPSRIQAWVALFRLLSLTDRLDDAEMVVQEALAALPQDPTLMWISAGILEKDGNIDGAIAIYEEMYAVDSDNLIVANNLASLLSSQAGDQDSIDRAATIARRLRSTDVPPYQDTYGWIAFLQGENDEAIKMLEPAAAALAGDPMVQYHLARAYLKAESNNAALEQFQKVIALTGEADTREFVVRSKQEAIRLIAEQQATE